MLKLVDEADAVDPTPAGRSWVALVPPSTEAGVAVALPAVGFDAVTALRPGHRPALRHCLRHAAESLRFGADLLSAGRVRRAAQGANAVSGGRREKERPAARGRPAAPGPLPSRRCERPRRRARLDR